MNKRLIRKPYERTRSTMEFLYGNEKQTDDSFGNDTDVNHIVARFKRTGIMPPPSIDAQYADVTALQADLTEIIARGESAKQELKELEDTKREQHIEAQKLREEKLAEYEKREKEQQAQSSENDL